MKLQDKVEVYVDDAIGSLKEIVKIKSVKQSSEENAPFGVEIKKALEYIIDLGKKNGMKSVNYDNYIGEIEIGEGSETLGILCHIDVVPEGNGWTFLPFSGETIDGKIYGRGSSDNKGPTIACFYAMKCLQDLNIKLNKKVKLIIGCDEESNWDCIKYYLDILNKPEPEVAFTPDAVFPVVFAEKGIFQFEFVKKSEDFKSIFLSGGEAINSVPDKAIIILNDNILEEELKEVLKNYNKNTEYKIDYKKLENRMFKLNAKGKSAHGAMVELGYNSIQNLFYFLKNLKISNSEFDKVINFFNNYIKMDLSGEYFGINGKNDELGDLTLNIGKINIIDDELRISVDIRYPASLKLEDILSNLNKIKKIYDFELEIIKMQDPLHIDKNSYLVSELLSTYQRVTGKKELKPVALSGGTYAKALKNCVGFGGRFEDNKSVAHQADEFMGIENFKMLLKIYIEAIYKLAQ